MFIPDKFSRPLSELLSALEDAVQAGDYTQAKQLEQLILQRIVIDTAECEAIVRWSS